MTNYEKIRTMPIHEVAEEIFYRTDECHMCVACELCEKEEADTGCIGMIIKWLEREVE